MKQIHYKEYMHVINTTKETKHFIKNHFIPSRYIQYETQELSQPHFSENYVQSDIINGGFRQMNLIR